MIDLEALNRANIGRHHPTGKTIVRRCLLIIGAIGIVLLLSAFAVEFRRTTMVAEKNFKYLSTDLDLVQKKMEHLENQITRLQHTLLKFAVSGSSSDSRLMKESEETVEERNDNAQPSSAMALKAMPPSEALPKNHCRYHGTGISDAIPPIARK